MLAIAAAGSYKSGTDPYDAVTNPALNLMEPIWSTDVGAYIPMRLYDILANMVDFVSYSQADAPNWGRGGWRYNTNDQDADNSVSQWPAIGAEAAEGWNLAVPSWVKSECLNSWCAYSFDPSSGGWGYDGPWYKTVSHGGAGLCLLSWCGVPKTDSRITKTLQWLEANWGGGGYTGEGWWWYPWPLHMQGGSETNYYAMYAVAKGCRVARDLSGHYSEISSIGTIDWYTAYIIHCIGQQQPDGSWPVTMSSYHPPDLNTPWAILIMTRNVSSLLPVAVLTASPNPTPPNQTVNFDISGSYHQDPAKWLASWQLDFDGNGTWDATGTFPRSTPIPLIGGYPDTGVTHIVNAVLRITGNDGASAETAVGVTVQAGNVPPVANAGGPYSGAVGKPITLDGSGSFSPNAGGSIVQYDWDTNGDGVYELLNAGAKPTVIFATPYTGSIGLKVTDNKGKTAVATTPARITVTDLAPVKYTLISYRRINRTVWEYVWKFSMKNRGDGEATSASATLMSWPSNVTVVDGNVSFGTIAAGATVLSADTFALRIDRSTAVANVDLSWKVSYTDAGGVTWILVNLPLFL